jgi:predicted ArsR family transcriptional regulator
MEKLTERQEQLVSLLSFVGPMSRIELERMMGLNDNAVMKTITQLKKMKMVRIVKYEHVEGKGRLRPLYAMGDKPDAPRPKTDSRAEIGKRYNEQNKFIISARRYADYHRSLGPWAGLLR